MCGSFNEITKHHIVPHCYVQFLQFFMRNERNLVSICRKCHDKYEDSGVDALKWQYVDIYGIDVDDEDFSMVKGWTTEYFRTKSFSRRQLFLSKIKEVIGYDPSVLELEFYKNMKKSTMDNPHKVVATKVLETKTEKEFIYSWRFHFQSWLDAQFSI